MIFLASKHRRARLELAEMLQGRTERERRLQYLPPPLHTHLRSPTKTLPPLQETDSERVFVARELSEWGNREEAGDAGTSKAQ